MHRGEIRWYTFAAPDKRRPVLLLTRDVVIDVLGEIIAPVTRTIRGIATEVLLTLGDGMPVTCAANLDHLSLARKQRLGGVLTRLPDERWPEVERALLIACGFRE